MCPVRYAQTLKIKYYMAQILLLWMLNAVMLRMLCAMLCYAMLRDAMSMLYVICYGMNT